MRPQDEEVGCGGCIGLIIGSFFLGLPAMFYISHTEGEISYPKLAFLALLWWLFLALFIV